MKRISILGATGSIGTNALDVVWQHPDRFEVVGLAAGRNLALLTEQIKQFRPKVVSVESEADLPELQKRLAPFDALPELVSGEQGAVAVATLSQADLVISAFVGAAGLVPTLAAIDAGKDIALANKEVLVVAGELIMHRAKAKKVALLPVDSEHSAIFQCLEGNDTKALRRILLTASGGPFRTRELDTFKTVTIDEALDHPKWKMGPKITIDSATMMNKGLELIEAKWLFDQAADAIEVHIHPESIINSMVEFHDGSIMAQLGVPDMRSPIAYAMSYPKRLPLSVASLNLFDVGTLHFERPDRTRFPALYLATAAAATGGSAPAVLNAANEIANAAFRENRLSFLGIAEVVESVLNKIPVEPVTDIARILDIDRTARVQAEKTIKERP